MKNFVLHNTKPNKCSGNVLFFILIAVALLGLLTIVISRGGDNVDQSGNIEQQRIKMSQLMRYAKSIEAGIQNLRLKGCSENEISFQNLVDTNYTNANSPSNQSCHIFEPEGAGLVWQNGLTNQSFTSGENLIFTGAISVYGVEENTNDDLLIAIPVSNALCLRINTEMSISTTTADITSDLNAWTKFTGAFTHAFDLGDGAGEAPGLTGKQTGCFIEDNGDYVFYQVLIAR